MIEALNGGIGIIVQENGTISEISVAENIFLGELGQFAGVAWKYGAKTSAIVSPSTLIVIGDMAQGTAGTAQYFDSPSNFKSFTAADGDGSNEGGTLLLGFRHSRKANIAYGDGHVESMDMSEPGTSDEFKKKWSWKNLVWP